MKIRKFKPLDLRAHQQIQQQRSIPKTATIISEELRNADKRGCRCPVCHSDMVKGNKVHTHGRWWSRCISGLDHGQFMGHGGKIYDWPETIWFEIETGLVDSGHGLIRIAAQEII